MVNIPSRLPCVTAKVSNTLPYSKILVLLEWILKSLCSFNIYLKDSVDIYTTSMCIYLPLNTPIYSKCYLCLLFPSGECIVPKKY